MNLGTLPPALVCMKRARTLAFNISKKPRQLAPCPGVLDMQSCKTDFFGHHCPANESRSKPSSSDSITPGPLETNACCPAKPTGGLAGVEESEKMWDAQTHAQHQRWGRSPKQQQQQQTQAAPALGWRSGPSGAAAPPCGTGYPRTPGGQLAGPSKGHSRATAM